ncbi:MAG: matrixin family metalloprotease [Patescibacteria group bacterium]
MAFLKKSLSLIFVVIAVAAAGFVVFKKGQPELRNYIPITKPCSSPLAYAIGNVDSRFNISKDGAAVLAQKAENVWESQTGLDLFQYDPNAQLKINFIFDARQQQAIEAVELEQKLGKLKISDNSLKVQYNNLYAEYSKEIDNYNSLAKKYEKEISSYNKEVNRWNKVGGAPPDEYEKLNKEQDALEAMRKKLEKERKSINDLINQMNSLASREKQVISSYNESLNTFRNKYGGTREFEKGIFNGQEVNIYQFNEDSDLELTITHELGHALGIGHVENTQSIMYYLMGEQDLDQPTLTSEDLSAFKSVCQL